MSDAPRAATLDDVVRADNLSGAFRRLLKVRGLWSSGVLMTDVRREPVAPMLRLAESLRSGSYQSGTPTAVKIAKADGTLRELLVFPVRDRVAQRAVLQAVSPFSEAHFLSSSYGFRVKRGVPQALRACERWVRNGYGFAVEADIANCFGSISFDVAMAGAARFVSDAALLKLIGRMAQGNKSDAGAGLAQGGCLSPWLCNTVLHGFDEAMHRACIPLVRYADDFVLFNRSFGEARRALFSAARQLATMGLMLKPAKTRILRPTECARFLGTALVRPLPPIGYRELPLQSHVALSASRVAGSGFEMEISYGTAL